MKKLLLLFLLAFLAVPIASAEEGCGHIDHNPRRGSKHQAVYLG